MKYIKPKILKEWINDIPNGELYVSYITNQEEVICAAGRYAASSVAETVTIDEFVSGKMQDLIVKTMGKIVLVEMLEFIRDNCTKNESQN
jgi:secreted protein with Ig-like and vWFA domain